MVGQRGGDLVSALNAEAGSRWIEVRRRRGGPRFGRVQAAAGSATPKGSSRLTMSRTRCASGRSAGAGPGPPHGRGPGSSVPRPPLRPQATHRFSPEPRRVCSVCPLSWRGNTNSRRAGPPEDHSSTTTRIEWFSDVESRHGVSTFRSSWPHPASVEVMPAIGRLPTRSTTATRHSPKISRLTLFFVGSYGGTHRAPDGAACYIRKPGRGCGGAPLTLVTSSAAMSRNLRLRCWDALRRMSNATVAVQRC